MTIDFRVKKDQLTEYSTVNTESAVYLQHLLQHFIEIGAKIEIFIDKTGIEEG